MEITVAICTYRRYPGVARAIESLRSQLRSVYGFHIYVIDNAPDNATAGTEALSSELSEVSNIEIIVEPKLGVANARNRALLECRTPLLAFLDDDCVASTHWLDSLISGYRESEGKVGAVGGRVLGIWDAPPPPWLSRSLLGYLSLIDWGNVRTELIPPLYLVGGNALYETNALREAGGFKAHLGRIGNMLLSNEEIEVYNSLRTKGYRVIYEPEALVGHIVDERRLNQSWFRNRIFWQAISDVLMASHSSDSGYRRPDKSPPGGSDFSRTSLEITDLIKEQPSSVAFEKQLKSLYQLIHHLSSG
jgi:glycosyltransferase involved in cell wall biosynthesis